MLLVLFLLPLPVVLTALVGFFPLDQVSKCYSQLHGWIPSQILLLVIVHAVHLPDSHRVTVHLGVVIILPKRLLLVRVRVVRILVILFNYGSVAVVKVALEVCHVSFKILLRQI